MIGAVVGVGFILIKMTRDVQKLVTWRSGGMTTT